MSSVAPAGAEQVVALETGVSLHYVERGAGTPVVFVHGGGKDYHYWDGQLAAFGARYRTIAYSRRYSPPNDNANFAREYNALVDASDLVALLRALSVGPAHFVAGSIGAVAALFVAVRHPKLVRSLVVAEPPLMQWARDIPAAAPLFERFSHDAFLPAGELFRQGQPERAMALLIDAFVGVGAFDRFPDALKRKVMRGAGDWGAQATSTVAFPELTRDEVRRVTVPVLMLSGGKTIPVHALLDDELERVLPRVERRTIAAASHDVWADSPDSCRTATLEFLAKH